MLFKQIILLLPFLFFTFTMAKDNDQDIKLLYEPNAPDYKPIINNQQSLFDKLAPDPSLSTFMDILTQVDDLFQLLNNTNAQEHNTITVFCPTNAAFKQELDVYTRDHLEEFLKSHIVPSDKIGPEDLKQHGGEALKTLMDGETIKVHWHAVTGRLLLNEKASVDYQHAVEAVNGFAYKIDHLLRPAATSQ